MVICHPIDEKFGIIIGEVKMRKHLVMIFLITMLIWAGMAEFANADYSFEIPNAQTTVEIESDGSMTIFVEYEFKNLGQKLDYIDIGLPNNNYTLSDIQVKLNGENNRHRLQWTVGKSYKS